METFYKEVVTRKTHSCCGCCEVIPKGASAYYLTAFPDGKATHAYLCKVCDAVACDPNGLDGEDFFDGEVRDSFPDLWEKHRKRLEEEVENA